MRPRAPRSGRTALDSRAIDAQYGLEPVIEPGQGAADAALGEFVEIECPWCGERIGTSVDLTVDEQAYIEDCQVCCRPIELTARVDAAGRLAQLTVRRSE